MYNIIIALYKQIPLRIARKTISKQIFRIGSEKVKKP